MPVITVQFIKDVVATPEQKRELLIRLTNAFIGIVGEVTRPFVYCIIKETPQGEWAIAGVPMPDLVYLTSDKHAQVIARANDMMRANIAPQQQPQQQQAAAASAPAISAPPQSGLSREEIADKVWRGALSGVSGGSTGSAYHSDADADTLWRGGKPKAGANGKAPNSFSADSIADDYPQTVEELAAMLKTEALAAEKVRVARNHEVVHRFYRAVNSKRRDELNDIVHPNFVNHGGASGNSVGLKALADSLNLFYTAMPDWHISEDYVVAQGDRVAVRGTITGTHLGPFMGASPSGKKVSWTSITIYRLDEDGRIVERWQDIDAMGMLQQLGVIPSMQ